MTDASNTATPMGGPPNVDRGTDPLTGLGLVSGVMAHDLNNALATVSASLHMLKRTATDDRSQDLVLRGQRGIDRATALARQLMGFARLESPHPARVAVGGVIEDCMSRLQHAAGPDLDVGLQADPAPHAQVDGRQLEQALTHLIDNARLAMPGGGGVRLVVQDASAGSATVEADTVGRWVAVSVHDEGVGMTPDILALAREPFFTTRNADVHRGLGLSIVHAFSLRAGGRLTLVSVPGIGTVATLTLPRVDGDGGSTGAASG